MDTVECKKASKLKTTSRVMDDLRHPEDTRTDKEMNARGLTEMHEIRNGLERRKRFIITHGLYFSKAKI